MLELKSPAALDAGAPVKSAQRVMDIFEFFATTRSPATLTTVASALRMPKSSCLALLTTLSSGGYLYEVRPQIGYYPTRRWLDNAQAISASDSLVRRIRPTLEELRDVTGETLILGKLSEHRILYIDVVESAETLRYTAVAGQFKPLHGTASGKAALSVLASDKRRAVLDTLDFPALTARTITDCEMLNRDIEEGIARGWQVSRGENVADATAVAVPLHIMKEIFVLVVAGPSQRLEPKLAAIGDTLNDARVHLEEPECRKREA
jgi:DNA-binding IclR family transcriptional regulator